MADIILDESRPHGEQMREIFDAAGPDLAHTVHWYPRPNQPHGGVVQVPDLVAEAHTAYLRGEDGVRGTEDDRPRKRGRRPAADKIPAAGDDTAKTQE